MASGGPPQQNRMQLLSVALKHYKRPEVQQAIVKQALDKEVAVKYTDKFGKRPDELRYPADVMESAKNGATSFHCSEELWVNPSQIDTNSTKKELESLRKGWDLVLDIDCPIFEYSRYAAHLVVQALKSYRINAVSCKFSGNKGFHIAVPFEAFPDRVGKYDAVELFPAGARAISAYISEMIAPELGRLILSHEKGSIDAVAEKVGKSRDEIVKKSASKEGYPLMTLNVESFLVIDTILISSRHLYRMPYSLHEKSMLASVPVDPMNVLSFEKAMAKPELIDVAELEKHSFLDRSIVKKGEAGALLTQALDYAHKPENERPKSNGSSQDYDDEPNVALPETYFPPCIEEGLKGMRDGKKRFVFVLLNYLRSIGWDYDRIETLLREWNKRNEEPLRETNLVAPIRYHKQKKQRVLPPNCAALDYYLDIGICKPDNLCKMIKNPAQYSKRKAKYAIEAEKPKKRAKRDPNVPVEIEYGDAKE